MSDDPVLHVLTAQSDAAKRGALAVWTVYDRPDGYGIELLADNIAECRANMLEILAEYDDFPD